MDSISKKFIYKETHLLQTDNSLDEWSSRHMKGDEHTFFKSFANTVPKILPSYCKSDWLLLDFMKALYIQK